MVMRYAHLAPGYLSEEVKKLDTFSLTERGTERAKKGQRAPESDRSKAKVARIVREVGSSAWTRTRNPPVNSLMHVFGLVGLRACSSGGTLLVFGVREKIVHWIVHCPALR